MKRLSEREWWTLLARRFENKARSWGNLVPLLPLRNDGICYAIETLDSGARMKRNMLIYMETRRLSWYGGGYDNDYWWSLSRRGMEARAKFCFRMAEERRNAR